MRPETSRRTAAFTGLIVPILLIGVGTIFSSCSVTRQVSTAEKVTHEPDVVSGPVVWEDQIDLGQFAPEEIVTNDGTGVFEIVSESGAASALPSGSGEKKAKVTIRYRLKYEPRKSVSVSIDSASVETQKETRTVSRNEKIVMEKKFWKYFSYAAAGMVIGLAFVIFIMRRRL